MCSNKLTMYNFHSLPNHFKMLLTLLIKRRIGLVLLLMMTFNFIGAQNTVVLPGNGASSSLVAPQGGVKYQRQFYLIDSAEVRRSGLQNGMSVNSIGFTIAALQNHSTRGIFRVYLQNTSDAVSRTDTNWTVVPLPGKVYQLSGLNSGNYEWQVRSNCGTFSAFSPLTEFKINNDTCKSPTHLSTINITNNSELSVEHNDLTFHW